MISRFYYTMVEEKDKVTEQKDGMMTAFYTCKECSDVFSDSNSLGNHTAGSHS